MRMTSWRISECSSSARLRCSPLGTWDAEQTFVSPLARLATHVELVDTVGSDLVRVEDAEVAAAAANTLLSGGLETTLVLEVVDTLADGLAVGGTLGGGLFAVATADTDAVDHVALLGLVAETARLVGARGAGRAVDDRELAVLPAAHAGDELENVRLLLGVELGEVPGVRACRRVEERARCYSLVGAHLD